MHTREVLAAAQGLELHCDAAPHWRLSWREADWWGPIGFALQYDGQRYRGGGGPPPAGSSPVTLQPRLDRFAGCDDLGRFHGFEMAWQPMLLPLRTTVRAYTEVRLIVFRVEARVALDALGTGRFEQPVVAWPSLLPSQRLAAGVPDGVRSYGHQYTEFALPVSGDANCAGFFFAPHRPAVVEPLLLIAPDGRTLLLAPLDHFHEQIIAVPRGPESESAGVRCGWHGDLAEVPAGFATELAVWAADGPRQALAVWAACLQARHRTQRPSRYADDLVGKLSYWTDNGATYYYRTLPDCDYSATLGHVVADLHRREIPVAAVQIDSWFYPHAQLRPVGAAGAPLVPPSGMMEWAPRADLFPAGFGSLRQQIGPLPLVFHSRHFSSRSPYFERYPAWRDGEYAHPADPRLYELLMAQAAGWGGITYEQDWMAESFLGVRGLRAAPGRARAWQESLDRAAREHGLSLQWCMATPADFFQTVSLRAVTSIRTSGDYRYLFDNGLNWVWLLHTNALARALGLNAFKDVFISHAETAAVPGEPYAEIEALLAVLSAGPVGIGDALGASHREVIMRTCREDGVLVKPDVPVAAIDRCFRGNSYLEPTALIGETYSAHPAGRWVYVVSCNASRSKQPLRFRVTLADLGRVRPAGPVLAYDWRTRMWARLEGDAGWDCALDFQQWDYRVLCPLLPGEVTVFGDVSKYATVGDRRVARITARDATVQFDVLGAPDTWVEVHGYAARRPRAVTAWAPGDLRTVAATDHPGPAGSECWTWDAGSGRWVVRVGVGPRGYRQVSIAVTGPEKGDRLLFTPAAS